MPIKIDSIGHCAIAATDIDSMADFYQRVLGFVLLERDPDHGGVFLSLAGTSHTIDLFPMGMLGTRPAREGTQIVHIAFKVASYAALRDAGAVLTENDVPVAAMLDHTKQRSIYFADPERNRLEIYFERSNWTEILAQGRADQDASFSFDEPAPDGD